MLEGTLQGRPKTRNRNVGCESSNRQSLKVSELYVLACSVDSPDNSSDTQRHTQRQHVLDSMTMPSHFKQESICSTRMLSWKVLYPGFIYWQSRGQDIKIA